MSCFWDSLFKKITGDSLGNSESISLTSELVVDEIFISINCIDLEFPTER